MTCVILIVCHSVRYYWYIELASQRHCQSWFSQQKYHESCRIIQNTKNTHNPKLTPIYFMDINDKHFDFVSIFMKTINDREKNSKRIKYVCIIGNPFVWTLECMHIMCIQTRPVRFYSPTLNLTYDGIRRTYIMHAIWSYQRPTHKNGNLFSSGH